MKTCMPLRGCSTSEKAKTDWEVDYFKLSLYEDAMYNDIYTIGFLQKRRRHSKMPNTEKLCRNSPLFP